MKVYALVGKSGTGKSYHATNLCRDKHIETLEQLQNRQASAVIMILTDESGERILVNREYRMAMAQWIYNFPAGTPGKKSKRSFGRNLLPPAPRHTVTPGR